MIGKARMSPPWPQGAQLAMSFVVNVEERSEASIARGDRGPEPVAELGVTLKKPVRNFGNESNYRYGIRAGAHAPRMMSSGLHLRIIGRPGRIGYLERFVRHARAHDKVWVVTRAEIAACWRAWSLPPA